MKNLIRAVLIFVSFACFGQIDNQMNTFGLRAVYNNGPAGELSYQRYLNQSRKLRLESGLGFQDKSSEPRYVKFTSTLQYVQPIFGNYNLYAGVGAGFGNYETELNINNEFLYTGILGIEWSDNFPLVFALDMRPEIRPNSEFDDDLNIEYGFSIRFQF